MPYKDPEKKRERDRAYRIEHLEEKRAYNRAYGPTHRDVKSRNGHTYYDHHKEEIKQRNATWRANMSPEQVRLYNALTKARQRGLPATLTVDEWREILERYEYRCAYCGEPFEQMDHVVPLSRNGGTTRENVVPTCFPCNRAKSDKVGLLFRTP